MWQHTGKAHSMPVGWACPGCRRLKMPMPPPMFPCQQEEEDDEDYEEEDDDDDGDDGEVSLVPERAPPR